jgi:tetratricopeptide (TPR) repeat protein
MKSSLFYAEKANEISPTSKTVQLNLAIALLEHGKTLPFLGPQSEGEQLIARALKICGNLLIENLDNDTQAQVENTIGRIYYIEKQYPQAQEHFAKAIVLKDEKSFRRNLAWTLYGDIEKGKTCIQRFLVLKEAKEDFEAAGDTKTAREVEGDIEKVSKKCRQ